MSACETRCQLESGNTSINARASARWGCGYIKLLLVGESTSIGYGYRHGDNLTECKAFRIDELQLSVDDLKSRIINGIGMGISCIRISDRD